MMEIVDPSRLKLLRVMCPDYETLGEHSDATRDIGREAQRALRPVLRAFSWHGQGTALLRASDIAQPGGFRRFFLQAEAEPLMDHVLRVQRESFSAGLASPLLPFYAGRLRAKQAALQVQRQRV